MFNLFICVTSKTNDLEKKCTCKIDAVQKKADDNIINFEIKI